MSHPFIRCAFTACFILLPLLACAQTLNIHNDVQTVATLTNTTATLTGKAELHVTGTGDPIPTCTIHLNSPDAWFFLDNIKPSVVAATFLSRVRVSGANAVLDGNVRVVQFLMGTVVIPQPPNFAAMEAFDGKSFTGRAKTLHTYLAYNDLTLGTLKQSISSFRLKRGYMATLATQENGTGVSKCFVAQDGDLEVGTLPGNMDNAVRFVRVFPWRWVGKKGICGDIEGNLNVRWLYNWNMSRNSPLDWEYVAIKQTRWWPGMGEDWRARGVNHLLGFNEPDRPDQANMTVAEAIAGWPELLGTGLRLGAPAVADPNVGWIDSFMAEAEAAGLRVDYVPVHYYRSHPNGNDPWGAAWNMEQALRSLYARVKRPLWVTEWNNGANWTGDPDPTFAQQQAAIDAMTWTLETLPFVERYSLYNWVEDVRRVRWDDGSLTDAGVTYRDRASFLAVRQILPNAETTPAAHYSFNGDTRDGSGNGHDATAVGAPTFNTGKYGQALVLDGATDYLQVSPRLGDSGDFSFAGWIYWGGGSNWQRVFDFGENQDRYFFLSPKAGGNTLRFAIKNGGAEQQLNWNAALPLNTWTHVAVTMAGNTGKLFVNGTLVNTNAAMTINPDNTATTFNYIGKSQFADPLFNGRLDDLRFFNTALSDAQVAAIAANAPPQFAGPSIAGADAVKGTPYLASIASSVTGGVGARTFAKLGGPAWLVVASNGTLTGVPTAADAGANSFVLRVTDAGGAPSTAVLLINVTEPPSLVARYAFDSNANAAVGGLHGVTSGSPVYSAGKYSTAIDLDGTDDFVRLPAGVADYPEITVAAWVFWDGGSNLNWQRIFDFGNGEGEYFLITPRANVTGNPLRFEIKQNGVSQVLDTTTLPTGQWVHVAVALGAGTGRLYINGALRDTEAVTIKPSDIAPTANFIGDSQFPADPLFNGRIDEFQIFNQALTGAQVAALVAARAPAFTLDPITKPNAPSFQPYEQTLAGSATDPDAGTTITYQKVSGPAWLTVAANGRVSGVPSASDAGTNRFIIRASDPTLLADDATLNITVPNATGLVAHYQFDGNLGNLAGGAAGTPTGSPAYESGVFDRALGFDGADDFVTLPSGIVNGLTDCTFTGRFRWDGGGAWQRVFDFGNGTAQNVMLAVNPGGNLQFSIRTTASNAQGMASPLPVIVGDWTHFAVTLSGNVGTLYVNGVSVATATVTHDPANFTSTLSYLGDSQFAADPLFNGAIDDFRIFSRVLSAGDIHALTIPAVPVVVPDSSFGGWASSIAFPAGQGGALADPDSDGLVNAWEYWLGSDPLLAGSGALPPAQVRTAAELGLGATGKTYLTLPVRVRKKHLSATLTAEAAPSIADLALPAASSHALQAGPPVADGEFEIFTFYFDTALEDSPTGTGFIRLRTVVQ